MVVLDFDSYTDKFRQNKFWLWLFNVTLQGFYNTVTRTTGMNLNLSVVIINPSLPLSKNKGIQFLTYATINEVTFHIDVHDYFDHLSF